MADSIPAAALPPGVKELLETCAERFDVVLPVSRYEVELGEGGEVLFVWLHTRVRGSSLGVFDSPR